MIRLVFSAIRYRTTRYLAAVAAGLVIVGLIAVLSHRGPGPAEPFFNDDAVLDVTQVNEPIEEDDPAWDCRVHGNGICGPTQATVPER